jgi:hypothetical protein
MHMLSLSENESDGVVDGASGISSGNGNAGNGDKAIGADSVAVGNGNGQVGGGPLMTVILTRAVAMQ